MLSKGDIVRVVSKTRLGDTMMEFIPIGTICVITEVCETDDEEEKVYYGINKIDSSYDSGYYYLEPEIEKLVPISVPTTEKLSGISYDCLVEIVTKFKDFLLEYMDANELLEKAEEEGLDLTQNVINFLGIFDEE